MALPNISHSLPKYMSMTLGDKEICIEPLFGNQAYFAIYNDNKSLIQPKILLPNRISVGMCVFMIESKTKRKFELLSV